MAGTRQEIRGRGGGLALILLALLGAAPSTAARPGTVSGTVTDMTEEPLVGVQVTIAAGEEAADVATTDKRGSFSLTVAAGEYRITFEKEGYATFESPLSVAAGGRQKVGVQLLDAAAGRRSAAAEPFNTGVGAYQSGDRAAAKESFLAALAIDPTLVQAHRLLADIHLEEGAWSEAAKAAEAFLAAQPDDRQVQLIAYQAYRELGDVERVTGLRRSLGADPEMAARLAVQAFNEGALADQAGDAETAAARFSEALELDAGLAAAHFGLAALHYRGDRHEQALASLEKGLAVEPESAQGRRLAFAIHEARGDAEAAGAALRSYAEVDAAGAAALLFERAETHFDSGDAAAARELLARVLEIQPDHARAHHLLGLAWLTADAATARGHLERFLELAPDDPDAQAAREILASLE